jgi:hypothetical protein
MAQTPHYETRLLAGVIVPDTDLINKSIALAKESLPIDGFNHVMRSWLNGQAMINRLPSDKRTEIDAEAYGVATILHDLGWYVQGSFDTCCHDENFINSFLNNAGRSRPILCH